jgi:hypothetical protein
VAGVSRIALISTGIAGSAAAPNFSNEFAARIPRRACPDRTTSVKAATTSSADGVPGAISPNKYAAASAGSRLATDLLADELAEKFRPSRSQHVIGQ